MKSSMFPLASKKGKPTPLERKKAITSAGTGPWIAICLGANKDALSPCGCAFSTSMSKGPAAARGGRAAASWLGSARSGPLDASSASLPGAAAEAVAAGEGRPLAEGPKADAGMGVPRGQWTAGSAGETTWMSDSGIGGSPALHRRARALVDASLIERACPNKNKSTLACAGLSLASKTGRALVAEKRAAMNRAPQTPMIHALAGRLRANSWVNAKTQSARQCADTVSEPKNKATDLGVAKRILWRKGTAGSKRSGSSGSKAASEPWGGRVAEKRPIQREKKKRRCRMGTFWREKRDAENDENQKSGQKRQNGARPRKTISFNF